MNIYELKEIISTMTDLIDEESSEVLPIGVNTLPYESATRIGDKNTYFEISERK